MQLGIKIIHTIKFNSFTQILILALYILIFGNKKSNKKSNLFVTMLALKEQLYI